MRRRSPEERETTIVYTQADITAQISTTDIRLIHRLTRLGVHPDRTISQYGHVIEAEYTVPRSWVRISPPRRRTSPAQRAAARRSIVALNARRKRQDTAEPAP